VNLWREAPVARAPPGAPRAPPRHAWVTRGHDRVTRGQGAQALQAALQAVEPCSHSLRRAYPGAHAYAWVTL
jgi:hypothetical protein